MLRQRMATGAAVLAAVVVGGVIGAVIGVPDLSGAQTTPSTTAAPKTEKKGPHGIRGGAEFEAAAKALNLTPAELREKLSDGTTTIADVADEQNVDLDTVIDAMTEADRERIEGIVNEPWPPFGERKPGGAAPGFRKGTGIRGGHFGGPALDDIAKALNSSVDELITQLRDGKTIKEIAEANGVDVDALIDTLVKGASSKLDEAVTSGHLTQEQADKIKAELEKRLTEFVENGLPKMGGRGPGAFPGRGPRANTP